MLEAGVAEFIASLPEIPANPTASPESEEASTTNVSSPIRFAASWPSAGRFVYSEKTSRGTLLDNSQPSSRFWSDWATALRSEYSARPKPGTQWAGSGCSSWPTPRIARGGYTRDNGDPTKQRPTLEGLAEVWRWPTPTTAPDAPNANSNQKQGFTSLGEAAEQTTDAWMTPNVPNGGRRTAGFATMRGRTAYHAGRKVQLDLEEQTRRWQTPATDSFRSRGGDRKDEMGLDRQARTWSTPRASDGEKGSINQSFGAGGVPLASQAAHWRTPQAGDSKRGKTSKRGTTASRGYQDQAGRHSLATEVSNWPGPSVMMTGDATSPQTFEERQRRQKAKGINGNGCGPDLAMAAKTWPTPATRDYRGTNSPDHVTHRSTGAMHLDQLPNFVAYGNLRAFPGQAMPTGNGSPSNTLIFYLRTRATTDSRLRSEMRSLLRLKIRARGKTWAQRKGWSRSPAPFVRPSFRRVLGPTFVEAMMRWPLGWTVCGSSVTGLIQWRGLMLTSLSMLCSERAAASDGPQGSLF